MLSFSPLPKLSPGGKVAIVSPSFAAPGKWPHVHELGLRRLREDFGLEPVEFPATRKIGASKEERSNDLIAAFESPEIKAVISSLGGDDQVTYIKHLPTEPFARNPKPFFGYSDNTHFLNFLWQNGVPSYYGGALFTQFAEPGRINRYTDRHLRRALFESGETRIEPSPVYCDVGLDWNDPENLKREKTYEPSEGWFWDGSAPAEGITWGGCIESIDEVLRHGVAIPSLEDFKDIILIAETSEEIPSADYVWRVFRALGERGILPNVSGFLIGRPKAWEFTNQKNAEEKAHYRKDQRDAILRAIREYNPTAPIVQGLDFGHSDPQVPMPYGMPARILPASKEIFVTF